MTNFQFRLPEFKPLFEPAKGAEQRVYSDPRACCLSQTSRVLAVRP